VPSIHQSQKYVQISYVDETRSEWNFPKLEFRNNARQALKQTYQVTDNEFFFLSNQNIAWLQVQMSNSFGVTKIMVQQLKKDGKSRSHPTKSICETMDSFQLQKWAFQPKKNHEQ
jgi:hypothetical protein